MSVPSDFGGTRSGIHKSNPSDPFVAPDFPNKPKPVQSFFSGPHQIFFALTLFIHPLTEAKAIFFMAVAERYNGPHVPCMLSDGGRPSSQSASRVPNKSKLVELLPPSLRQSLFVMAPIAYPLTEAKAIFFMIGRNATVTFALLVDRQIAEAFLPVRFEWVPNKSKLIQLLSAWCR